MDGSSTARTSLEAKWLQRAQAAFQRMFDGKNQEELVTFTQREDLAVLIARELAAFLLEEHLALEPARQPQAGQTVCCPRCGQPGQSAMKPDEALLQRQVTTRAGDVRLTRERWRCAKCRILFFSGRCAPATGHGGV
jgi:hypothetical protein